MEPEKKKAKSGQEEFIENNCKHFVLRKKRFCKMTVKKGKDYCGEHEILLLENNTEENGQLTNRIPCPMDPKHTIYKHNLKKHLKICNARPTAKPSYIIPRINIAYDNSDSQESVFIDFRLDDIDEEPMARLIEKIEYVFNTEVKLSLFDMTSSAHEVVHLQCQKEEYGAETKKHLYQVSAILGCLNHLNLLNDDTSFIEFGAGKGSVTYWLSKAIEQHANSNIVLVDRASHRHKKDNKIEDRASIHRIRADIADFEMNNLEILKKTGCIVGVGKHLCGGATDLALRCLCRTRMLSENVKSNLLKVKGFLISTCCHHRCDWNSFIGREFFLRNDFNKSDFQIIIKMVSWAICGDGLSREARQKLNSNEKYSVDCRKEAEIFVDNQKCKFSRNQKAEIGKMCKRIIDYSRMDYMINNGFKTFLYYYVKDDVTLENVCIAGQNTSL